MYRRHFARLLMVALLVVSSVAITPGLSAAHSLVYSTAANRSAPV